MKFFRLPLALVAAAFALSPRLPAQDRIVVNDSIDALMKQGIMPITVVSDDQAVGDLVRFALGAHGAFSVRAASSVRVSIGRTGTNAVVACDHPTFGFQTTVEARDQDELALRVADAAVVGLGRAWKLKPLFAATKVAFVSKYTGNQEIYTTNLVHSRTSRITNLRNTTHSPRWSPDGTRLYFITSAMTGFPEVFSTNGAGNPRGDVDVHVAAADGSGARAVVATPDVDADPSWSPDGARLVLTSGPTGRPGIYVSSAAGGGLTRLSTGYGYSAEPAWNPVETSLIAFTYQSGGLHLAVADLQSGTITAVPTTSPMSFAHASWCADGRHVLATQSLGAQSWISIVDTKTGKATRLTDSKLGECSQPACHVRRN
jgi:TolB protein